MVVGRLFHAHGRARRSNGSDDTLSSPELLRVIPSPSYRFVHDSNVPTTTPTILSVTGIGYGSTSVSSQLVLCFVFLFCLFSFNSFFAHSLSNAQPGSFVVVVVLHLCFLPPDLQGTPPQHFEHGIPIPSKYPSDVIVGSTPAYGIPILSDRRHSAVSIASSFAGGIPGSLVAGTHWGDPGSQRTRKTSVTGIPGMSGIPGFHPPVVFMSGAGLGLQVAQSRSCVLDCGDTLIPSPPTFPLYLPPLDAYACMLLGLSSHTHYRDMVSLVLTVFSSGSSITHSISLLTPDSLE